LNFFNQGFLKGFIPVFSVFGLLYDFISLSKNQLGFIIGFTFFLITQGFISFIDRIEFLAVIIRIIQIFIRMVFNREFSKGFLHFIKASIESNSQNIIIGILSPGLL